MAKPKITNRLPQFATSVKQRAQVVALECAIRGASEAAAVTPRDTSTLINSQIRGTEVHGSKVIGKAGYTAEYALAVHEAEGKLKGQKRPKRDGSDRGLFWGPSGQPEFLKEGFQRARPWIDSHIKKAMKR